jgi:hypothetical protein
VTITDPLRRVFFLLEGGNMSHEQSSQIRNSNCFNPIKDIYSKYIFGANAMATTHDSLLLKFRTRDSLHGVTRLTVKALAQQLDVNETQVVHLALSKLASEILPSYEPDDGPLSERQIKAVRRDANDLLPIGETIREEVLFG